MNHVDWRILYDMETDDAYSECIKKLNECIDILAHEETSTFPHQNVIREAWVTKGLLISSKVLGKLYTKKGNKPPDYEVTMKHKKYRNLFNSIKKKAREAHYSNLLTEAKNDIKKTWQILRPLIGKQQQKEPILNKFIKVTNFK